MRSRLFLVSAMLVAIPAHAEEPAAESAEPPPHTPAQTAPAEAAPAAAAETAEPPAETRALEHRLRALEDEIRALKDADVAVDADPKEPTFRLFGFMDIGLQKLIGSESPITSPATTFVLGNVNVYFGFNPTPDWSSLIEVRFTNYPAGEPGIGVPLAGVEFDRTDTSVQDPGNGEGHDSVQWGAIILERAYIQWQRHAKLGVRVGQFLTPYGIWNVDHGTPTLISLQRPKFISREMFPQRQLGVEVFGHADEVLPGRWRLGYHAYVSNGRTSGPVDPTDKKMVGGRVLASVTRPTPMTFGVSAMAGEYVDNAVNLDPITLEISRPARVQYGEWGVAADASIDVGKLRLRGEAALRQVDYADGRREMSFIRGVYKADGWEGDLYGLAAYRIGNTKLEPYLYGELYRWPSVYGSVIVTSSVGANYYFTPEIQLKAQFSQTTYAGAHDPSFTDRVNPSKSFVAAKLVMGF